jgi:hypothetical protein
VIRGWLGGRWRHLAAISLAYAVLAAVMTWPLAAQLPRGLAADYADPLFICWVLMWTGGQVLSAIGGDPGALARYWDGNIFHPDRHTIAYSEHFTAQMLQILPLYGVTDNILLCYNLLFLSTFVLSGVAVYWLVRDLTGSRLAAFVAGLAFAYSPYRLGQLSHLQILSSQWMPLALVGYRRFFATGRLRALAGGAAAWLAQNLSCGYYLLFFSPFLAAYWLVEMTRRRRLGDSRMWIGLAASAAIVGALTWPFVAPYLEVRKAVGLGARAFDEIVSYSSDTRAFATVPPVSRLWGPRIAGYPKAEGIGFLGFTTLLLAATGIVAGLRASWRARRDVDLSRARRALVFASAAATLVMLVALVWICAVGTLTLQLPGRSTMHRNATPILEWFGIALAVSLWVWPRRGREDATASRTNTRYWTLAALASALFALGPRIEAAGHRIGTGPYVWLLQHVPGFDGLRVPSRFLMLTSLFLAVLTGLGAAALLGSRRRLLARAIVGLAAVGILAEAWMVPMPVNVPLPVAPLATPPQVTTGRRLSLIYRTIRDDPSPVVLIEFPFGEPAFDLQAVYYAGYHRRPLVNGYSGFFPGDYAERSGTIDQLRRDPGPATAMLRASGATHAIVHEAAYPSEFGRLISAWLISIGAEPVMTHGTDRLFAIR